VALLDSVLVNSLFAAMTVFLTHDRLRCSACHAPAGGGAPVCVRL
jgi:hypothetical protein